MNTREPTPGFVIGLGLTAIALLVSIVLAVGGSYLLTLDAIGNAKAYEAQVRAKDQQQQKQIAEREQVANLRAGIPTCKAIVQMDEARNGAVNASSDPNSYGHRLAKAIHNVAIDSHCEQIVNDLNHGWTLKRILAQQKAEANQTGS